jgi:hypothetical protein
VRARHVAYITQRLVLCNSRCSTAVHFESRGRTGPADDPAGGEEWRPSSSGWARGDGPPVAGHGGTEQQGLGVVRLHDPLHLGAQKFDGEGGTCRGDGEEAVGRHEIDADAWSVGDVNTDCYCDCRAKDRRAPGIRSSRRAAMQVGPVSRVPDAALRHRCRRLPRRQGFYCGLPARLSHDAAEIGISFVT